MPSRVSSAGARPATYYDLLGHFTNRQFGIYFLVFAAGQRNRMIGQGLKAGMGDGQIVGAGGSERTVYTPSYWWWLCVVWVLVSTSRDLRSLMTPP